MGFLATILVLVALGAVQNAEYDENIATGTPVSVTKWEKVPALSSFSSDGAARGRVLPTLMKRAYQVREDSEARVPLPGPIPLDTDQLKKIAEILSVIGQQASYSGSTHSCAPARVRTRSASPQPNAANTTLFPGFYHITLQIATRPSE